MIAGDRQHLIGIDIGAGSGAKLGLFASPESQIAEAFLPVERYGSSAAQMADALAGSVKQLLRDGGVPAGRLLALGMATPGLLRSDGSFLSVANLPFLNGANLGAELSRRLRVPARPINDADAGALAEWTRRRRELLYWVLGGGWGGAWVSAAGIVRFPAVDWDGNDASLHYTNEPGYAIPLSKEAADRVLGSAGGSYPEFEAFCLREIHPPPPQLLGPCGRRDAVRAELFVSGPGRWRLFRYWAQGTSSYKDHLSPAEARQIESPGTAGAVLDKLTGLGNPTAVRADTVFGMLLAEAAGVLYQQAEPQGCPRDIPIFMGGRPSRALRFFGPATEQALRQKGIASDIRLSCFDEENKNANLFGAAFAAKMAARPGP